MASDKVMNAVPRENFIVFPILWKGDSAQLPGGGADVNLGRADAANARSRETRRRVSPRMGVMLIYWLRKLGGE
jgi:hypothetical protein